MAQRLAATFVSLVHDAAVRSFWRRRALSLFLRQVGISESFLATWAPTESKRDFLNRLFAKLPDLPKGQDLILSMARDLAFQDSFPDLVGWEDSDLKIQQADLALRHLKVALEKIDRQVESEKDRREARERFRGLQEESRRSREDLSNFEERLTALASAMGSQKAGYEFQTWFHDVMDHFEITNRRPYVSNGRQIDGSITVSGTTYLIELKFTTEQASAPEIDTLVKKVTAKADNTMGIMVSISGFSSTAVREASGPRTPILLFDHGHLYLALRGAMDVGEIVNRSRRHASQTGEAYLPVPEMG